MFALRSRRGIFPITRLFARSAAVGAGCTIIIKGPEDTPSAVVAIARMFDEAGLPPGVLNVVWESLRKCRNT